MPSSPQHAPPTPSGLSGPVAEDLALYREKFRGRLPESLDELHGPTQGAWSCHCTWPAWSGMTSYDLGMPRQRMGLYRTVLDESLSDDLPRYLNQDLLLHDESFSKEELIGKAPSQLARWAELAQEVHRAGGRVRVEFLLPASLLGHEAELWTVGRPRRALGHGAMPRLSPFHRRLRRGTDVRQSGGPWDRPLDAPTERRLLLVLTDGVGRAWHEEELPGALARQCHVRPTAALQVLPRRLWHRTALRTIPVQARVLHPARPVPALRARAT
ncbi:hypothetical protein ACWGIV_36615 [Streptomyces sp. NPDC054844]